ncbi:MAG: alanine racemase [Chloroflexota bacterium]
MGEAHRLHSTWAEVDLGVVKHNIRFFLNLSKTEVMAIVKANAYGHGAVQVARAALEAGASWCGVARTNEALELRQAGLNCPVLILGYTPEGQYSEMIAEQVSLTVWNLDQVKSISAAAGKLKKEASVHINVDTGMHRLGAEPSNALALIQASARLSNIRIAGLFTHFARADEAAPAANDAQEEIFQDLLAKVDAEQIRIPMVHAANSAASLTRPSVHFNCLRIGIAMYGLHPSADCPLPPEIKPALKWTSALSQVKTLPAGSGVSYGHQYRTSRRERIGTVPVGYADGFRRVTGNFVLVGGQKVPVVGRVTMDQIMVQLDEAPDAKAGDEVVLLGEQGGAQMTAEEIAGRWGTINYEVTSGISGRVPRLYRSND